MLKFIKKLLGVSDLLEVAEKTLPEVAADNSKKSAKTAKKPKPVSGPAAVTNKSPAKKSKTKAKSEAPVVAQSEVAVEKPKRGRKPKAK